jgi:hypothetical protein
MLTVFVLSLPVFIRFSTTEEGNDYGRDRWLAFQGQHNQGYPAYPLYHFALIATTLGNPLSAGAQGAVLLALATGVAAGLTAIYFASRAKVSVWQLTLLCLALAIVMPLPNRSKFPVLYLGQVSPNVWHHPTAIFSVPFALAVYLLSLCALERFSIGIAAGLGVLMSLSLLAKPNYLLAFAPCLAVALNIASEKQPPEKRSNMLGQLLRFGLAFVVPALVFCWQVFDVDIPRGSVSFAPFEAWGLVSPNIPGSIVVGIVFPLTLLLTYGRRAVSEPGLLLCWITLAIAIVQYMLLSDIQYLIGGQASFVWGMMLADRVLFVASCEFLLRQPPSGWRILNWAIFGLHTIAGAVYLARSLIEPSRVCDF